MEKSPDIKLFNNLEVHYWFVDDSHTMDAFIYNKCEYELLGIARELGKTFRVELFLETEPLAEGGLKHWLRIALKKENKNASITVALISGLFLSVIFTPISTSISKVAEIFIERMFEDKELKELEKHKLKLEIAKLKQEVSVGIAAIDSNNIIKKKKSNFYETLNSYPKVTKVSFLTIDRQKNSTSQEYTIHKQDFDEYILTTDELEPTEHDNAIIEIISPVLKKGKYKWMGIYEGEPVPFSMRSTEFKQLVQSGKIQFKNGTSINCQLTIKKKIDSEGIERIISIEVNRVNHYFENDKPIETSEGRQHRHQKEADKAQLKLFAKKEDEDEQN